MFKKFIFLFVVLSFLLSFAYVGPNVKYPFKQISWSGGSGQDIFTDETKFLSSERIYFLSNPLTLDYIEDTNFTLIGTYPPAAAGVVGTFNDLFNFNDTIFALGGLPANLSYSTNKGQSWFTFDTLPVNQNNCEILAFQKVNDTIYVGGYWGTVNFGFIYKSSDMKTWSNVTQPTEAARVYNILHIGGDTFLVAAGDPDQNSADFDGQILRTTDRFQTYDKIDTLGYLLITNIIRYNGDTLIASGDNILYGEPILISTDNGVTWGPSGSVDSSFTSSGSPFALLSLAKIGNYIFTGSYGIFGGGIYRSIDAGNTWEMMDTSGTIPDTCDITGFYSFDNGSTIYVTATYPGALYKSTDGGYTFTLCDLITDISLKGMVKLGEHTFGVGSTSSTSGAKIYYDSYFKNGYLISSAINIDKYDTIPVSDYFDLYNLFITFNKPNFTTFTLKMRSSSDSTMVSAPDWSSCPSITTYNDSSKSLVDITSITNQAGHHYIQYRIDFTTTRMELTPSVDSIWIEKVSGIENLNTFSKENISITFAKNRFIIDTKKQSILKIFDIAGRNVINSRLVEGRNTIKTDLLPSGKYILKIFNNSEEIYSKPFNILH